MVPAGEHRCMQTFATEEENPHLKRNKKLTMQEKKKKHQLMTACVCIILAIFYVCLKSETQTYRTQT